MRRTEWFLVSAVVLVSFSLASSRDALGRFELPEAQASTMRPSPLARGWFRIPSGTVYLSDGASHVCGYGSWVHFTSAGGSSGAWTQLVALPAGITDDGLCPAFRD